MRFPNSHEILEGMVCVCSTGRAAIVTGRDEIVVPRTPEEASYENQERSSRGLDPYPFTWIPAGDIDPETGETLKEGRGFVTIEGWAGIGLDGKGAWFSSSPVILSESADAFRQKLVSRFGGKLTYNV